jgi:hypothetical protein
LKDIACPFIKLAHELHPANKDYQLLQHNNAYLAGTITLAITRHTGKVRINIKHNICNYVLYCIK